MSNPAGPRCAKCDRVHCQLAGMPHDKTTPQVHPGFEHIKPVDFNAVLDGVKIEPKPKGSPKGLKKSVRKIFKQVNAPKTPKGARIGGGDARTTDAQKDAMIREMGGDPCKMYVGGTQSRPLDYKPVMGREGGAD